AGKKLSGWEGKGSMKLNKVNSRMAMKLGNLIKTGQEIKVTIISKLADPAAFGAERIVLKQASFDDLTLADWSAQKNGEVDCPFTFEDYEFLDLVAPM
ncbi:MAG TPA: phage tail tube protein, partial [Ruminiclostridium sp.]|nr:phage tail tube protein [Ruminiclostridium sp.]